MPYNPCGYIVDVTRRMHDEPCRFFRNNDRIDTVRFYEALPNAPTLPFWSVVYCCENDPVKWPDDRIGTLRRTPFPFTGRVSPAGLAFNHICGTVDEFANGAIYDPARPPAPVGANGLPLCCFPPPRVGGGGGGSGAADYRVLRAIRLTGGGGAGGLASYSAFAYIDPADGGVEVGGAAGDLIAYTDAAAGGVEVGGAAGDVLAVVDAAAGGAEMGGSAGDVLDLVDVADGGLEHGGSAGDVLDLVDVADGGVEVGGAAGDLIAYTDAAAGGVEVGGSAGDVLALVDAAAGGLEHGGSAGDVFTPPSVLPYTNGTFLSTLQGDSLNGSTLFTATDQFTFSSGATIAHISIDVLLFFAPTGTTVSWSLGTTAFGSQVTSGVSLPTVVAMGSGPSGQLIYRLTWTVSVPLVAGSYWLTITDVLRSSLGGVKWQYTSGATNAAQADSGGSIGSTTPHWFQFS